MHTLKRMVYVGTVIVALSALGGCASTASPSPSPTAVPTGKLEGTVSDAGTGTPVEGAQVTVAGQVGVFTVTTGPDGVYEVADLPTGTYLVSAQATGYYVNTAQKGVVADVTSSGDIALEPDVVAVVTATPTDTPASPATPSPTPAPSATPSPTPEPTPTPSPVSEATPIRQVFADMRPASHRAAPVLLEPRDGSVFAGPKRITFRWSGPCCLAADEYYVVSIPHPQGVEEAWVKTTAWESPDYLYLLVPESRRLTWNVSVRRHTGEYPSGQWKGPIVSPISETWHFFWYRGEDGADSPLPTPSPMPTQESPLPTPGP